MGIVYNAHRVFHDRKTQTIALRNMRETREYVQVQREREAYVEGKLKDLKDTMDAPLRDYRLKIAPLAKGMTKDYTVPEMLRHGGYDSHEHYGVAVAFMRDYGQEVFEQLFTYQSAVANMFIEAKDWEPGAAIRKIHAAHADVTEWIRVLSNLEIEGIMNPHYKEGNK